MRNLRRRAVPTLRGRRGAAAYPAPEVVRADWRAIVARAGGAAPVPAAPPAPPVPALRRLTRHPAAAAVVATALSATMLGQATALLAVRPAAASSDAPPAAVTVPPVTVTGPKVALARPPARRAAVPVTVTIERIGVRTTLLPLALLPDGTLDVPDDYDRAGWYTRGARPGERGPAVVVGHVDSQTGPAVFARLRELRPGDVVRVRRADRTEVRFAVTTVRSVPKTKFPTKAVYGATRRPVLRLVTCGGAFDRRAGSYRDNVVVFADLVTPRRGTGVVTPRSGTKLVTPRSGAA